MALKRLFVKLEKLLFPEDEKKEESLIDTSPIEEVIEGMRGRYTERVKPLIEEGKYIAAAYELKDIYAYWQFRAKELFSEVHSSLNYLGSMRTLIEKLETATEKPINAIETFEAYQAQTKLPL